TTAAATTAAPLVEFPEGLLALRRAAGTRLATAGRRIAPAGLLGIVESIARREHDFELIEFVPLSIGSISVGNREKRLQALTGGWGLWRIHVRIIPLLRENLP
ncbi:MAG: hypothetical protein OEW21_20045, partial [Betaproteobacteria bacterium]|nr:hypothetical protein [Betaproteobacteria bacterium]